MRGSPATSSSRPVLGLLRSYRARTHIVSCETAPDELDRRNRARTALVPRAVIARRVARWTVLDPSEAHRLTYAVPPGGDLARPPEVE